MIELIIFLISVIGITIFLTRRRKQQETIIFEDDDETVVVAKPACSSCSGGKSSKKFDLRPMGAELDPNSPIRPKIIDPNGMVSTIVTNKPDITNLYRRPWQDFYPTSGQSVFAPATQATWGLANSWENAPVRACGRVAIPVPTQPCESGIVQQMAKLLYTRKY